MRDLFVPVNGIRLHVVDYGGDGPPVLLLHGTGLVAQVWEPVAAELRSDFRLLALDRRGHGDSDKPAEGYQREDSAADTAGVIAALGIEGCFAAGHSSGGAALIVVAADHPGSISRAALLDPIIFGRRAMAAAGNPMSERTRRRRSEWPSAEEMFRSLRARPPYDTWRDDALWAFVNHGTRLCPDGSVTLKCPPALEATMYRHGPGIDLFEKLASVNVPLLIVRAERSDRFPRENAERARTTAPDCTLIELPGTTHFLPMEEPDTVAALLRHFFRGEPVTE